MWFWRPDRHTGHWDRTDGLEVKRHRMWSNIFNKARRRAAGKETISINSASPDTHMQNSELVPLCYATHKLNIKAASNPIQSEAGGGLNGLLKSPKTLGSYQKSSGDILKRRACKLFGSSRGRGWWAPSEPAWTPACLRGPANTSQAPLRAQVRRKGRSVNILSYLHVLSCVYTGYKNVVPSSEDT